MLSSIKTLITDAMHTQPDGNFKKFINFKCCYKFIPALDTHLLYTVYVADDVSKSNIITVNGTTFSIDAKLYMKDSTYEPRDIQSIIMIGGNNLRIVTSAHHTDAKIPFHCELFKYAVNDIKIEHIGDTGVDEITLSVSCL